MSEYCEDLKLNNPSSTIVLECTFEEDSRCFECVFTCYSALATGFQYCCLVHAFNSTHLKSKYQGILLIATTTDANELLFPLTYAVLSTKNDDNWLWFNQLLCNIITQHDPSFLNP